MKDFITFFFCFTSIILFIILIFKKNKIDTINKEIEDENKKLELEKDLLEKQIKSLDIEKDKRHKDLSELEKITNNMDNSAREAFDKYCDLLNSEYFTTEKEYDEMIADLKESYNKIQDRLLAETAQAKKDLDKISSTRAAAMEAQLKEQEIKNKQTFYCPQVPEADLKDAKTLRDIEYKLNNPRVLRMLIWSTFYTLHDKQYVAAALL